MLIRLEQRLRHMAPLLSVFLATCAPNPTGDVGPEMTGTGGSIGLNGETIPCSELSSRLNISDVLGEKICASHIALEGLLQFTPRRLDGTTYEVDTQLQLHGESARTLFETIGPSHFSTYGPGRLTCEGRERGNVACMKLPRGDYACNIILNAATGEARRPAVCR
jgi:hypothetical protein